MMGERSSPFVSGIAVLLICAELLCFSASQSTTCTMPSVEEGQATTLTVEFGFNLQDEEHHRDVIIMRGSGRGTTDKTEELVDCYWDIKDYRCKVKNSRFYFNHHITENMTLLLPHASKEDAGKYFIMVTGSKINSCSFSLGDGDSGADVNTTTLIRPDENTATLTVVTVVMAVSLLLNLAVGICYLIKKRMGKRSTCNNGVNNALERLLPCWSREEAKVEEAKEPVQATDLGIKKRMGKRSTCNNGVNNALARLLPCWSRDEAKVEEAKEPVQATDLGEKGRYMVPLFSHNGKRGNPEDKEYTATHELQGLLDVWG